MAVNGCCLTVVAHDATTCRFQAGPETLRRTNLGDLRPGDRVNLERSLRVGDRLGGHIVQGHIDGVGRVDRVLPDGDWVTLWFACPPELSAQMVTKGSVAVDGVSLTLVDVEAGRFSVALIPHTLAHTTLGFEEARRSGEPGNGPAGEIRSEMPYGAEKLMDSNPRQTLSYLRNLFEERGLHPKNKLGQNFLIDLNLIDLLVRTAELTPDDVVLEVGSGTGSLTVRLLERAGAVVSVEVDPAFAIMTDEAVCEHRDRVALIHGDALKNKNELNPDVFTAVARTEGTHRLPRISRWSPTCRIPWPCR